MIKIFVVDDDQFLGTLYKTSLEKFENVKVTHFTSPLECLNNLQQNPDIITIDYLMPEMNGIELMMKIKNYNDGIQCIMLSGQEELDVVIDTYKKGANDYIIKNESAIVNIE